MKQDPGLPLRTRLASSEQDEEDEDDGPPDSPPYGPQDDEEAPMDLRKKPEKEEEKDKDRGDPAQAEQVLNIWQKALFTGMHPYLSLILGGGGNLSEDSQKGAPIFPYGLLAGNGELLTPSTPVICDQFGVRHAVFRTPEGGVTTVPLSGFADQLKGCRDPEEARSPAIYGRSLRAPTSELLSRLQSAPCHRTTYNGTSFREESEPEDLTVNRTSHRQDSENEEDDLRRSKSCSDIPRYPDPDMLDRVRVKSDSESPVSWSTPVGRLTSTAKRKVEEPGGEASILNSPITRLLDPKRQERSKMLRLERQDPPSSAPPSEQESFLQKLRQAAPVPWNVYSYYTQMMQSLSTNDHEVLRGHLSSSVPPQASAVNSGKSSPSPATTPLSSSPPSANGDSRKNARVLTGKHVRHGTGASPSTLLTLRQKIQERQKAKELACAQSCAQQDSKHKDMSRKRAAGKVRLVKQ